MSENFPKLKLYDKIQGCYIIPYEGKEYDDIDLTYADGKWYITGGEELTTDKYRMEIV